MIRSLRGVGEDGQVVVLALDTRAAEGVADLDGVVVVTVSELEAAYPVLSGVKGTLTPWLTMHAMSMVPPASWTTYLDADLYFFSGVDAIYEEMAAASVGIIPHRFPRAQQWRLKYGTYNVGWVSFRHDDEGLACLRWWADRCRDWCYDEPSAGRFADQGYLDQFADVTPALAVISHPGADLAPWNLAGHAVTAGGVGPPSVDGSPLIFFHFHGLRIDGDRYYFKHLPYRASTSPTIRDEVYRPYCRSLRAEEAQLQTSQAEAPMGRRPSVLPSVRSSRAGLLRLLSTMRGDFLDL
jgi:hypothetical protein